MNISKMAIILLMLLLSGCQVLETRYPPAPDYYYINPNKDLTSIGRVALIELENESTYPQISPDITKTLFQALQKKQVFGISVINKKDSQWQSLQLGRNSTYNLEQLSMMRKKLKADAILKGTVTGYQPFPYLTISLRLKLLDLTDGQLIWAFEQVWDSSDKITQQRIKNYFKSQTHSEFAHLSEELVTVSSLKFIKFVVYEIAESIKKEY